MTPAPAEKPRIPRPVWFLGLTSLFTDAATEMIYPLLPVYLSQVLGAGALSLGIIGYAISAIARPFIAVTTSWPQVLVIRALDRVGKGIRGAPRDVLLAGFATPTTRGRIYGFHRAMDHTGAIVGPLLATVFLFFMPEQYRLLFGLTLIPGAIAVALLFLVDEDAAAAGAAPNRDSQLPKPKSQATRLPGRVIALLGVLLVF